jgi:CheY-like chemotaxis protein
LTEEGNQAAKAVAKEVGATAVLTKPLDPERLLVLTMAVTGTVDRRRAKRITPFIACETELQFAKAKKKISSAIVVNISDTGILLRTPLPPRGLGYVYDIATLVLRPAEGEPINVSAQILRVEAETNGPDSEKKILMAFEYQQMDVGVRKSLRQYLQINDPETVAVGST